MPRLEAALSDPSKFGMAKSVFMAGREAGFDMDSPAGIDAWMRAVQSRPWPQPLAHRVAGKDAVRARKQLRKAARNAPKRNR